MRNIYFVWYLTIVMTALNMGDSFSPQLGSRSSNIVSVNSEATVDAYSETIEIELVSTKKRALDLRIYKNFSVTPEEYIYEQKEKEPGAETSITKDEAIDLLMPGYDERGNYIEIIPPNGHELNFVAIHKSHSQSGEDAPNTMYARQNGVVGTVRAQPRNLKETFIWEDPLDMQRLPPHLYLSNLSVHEDLRRRGIGNALISAVASYASSMEGVDAVILCVDNTNIGAIRMYENDGYKYISQNEEFGTMVKHLV